MLVVMLQARSVVLVMPFAYLELDLVKAALMPEAMTETHLGPIWDRSVEVLVAKVFEGSRWGR